MDKKIFVPIIVVGLSLAFVAVSFAVYLSRGKSGFWISRKMLLGSLLISLTSIANQSCDRVGVTCYDPVMPNNIELDAADYNSTIEINLNDSSRITGLLYERNGADFSFNVTDTLVSDTLQVGEVMALDGEFDEGNEEIFVELDTSLPASTYMLNLYDNDMSNQEYAISTYKLIVRNED